eukprot:TRINITY_DN5133_c0_g3_i1.p2 TRINITY_DN5133_c0_g3~~TRINITY_DN5133_c0_g3_i1.p2  ORF type:complete len:315 (-),score=81.82 TRINITY_DN5133_c0_g3_i1:59-1003(-)
MDEREALAKSDLASKYEVAEEVLYSGLNSAIFLGTPQGGLRVGIKVYLKRKLDGPSELKRAIHEIELHRSVPPHPNVVRLVDAEVSNDAILLATPYTPCGDLWALTRFGTTFCEREVRNCSAQMLEALHHIHAGCDMVHMDIKPHNFLLYGANDGSHVLQLCDFGLAEQPGSAVPFCGLRGTSGWFAPEVIQGMDHDFAVDLFGVGLILFRMLAGYAPFDPPTNFEAVEFEERYWCHISAPCRDFILRLLSISAQERGTAAEALAHPWIADGPPPEPSDEQLAELSKFGPPPCTDVRFWPAGLAAPMLPEAPMC